MESPQSLLGLDVGTVRIGVARASSIARLPEPLTTLQVDGTEIDKIKSFIKEYNIDTIVVGLPQNLEGEDTKQTQIIRNFVAKLEQFDCDIKWQDERLSSVRAKQELNARKRMFQKGDVDSLAAVYILEDYLNKV